MVVTKARLLKRLRHERYAFERGAAKRLEGIVRWGAGSHCKRPLVTRGTIRAMERGEVAQIASLGFGAGAIPGAGPAIGASVTIARLPKYQRIAITRAVARKLGVKLGSVK